MNLPAICPNGHLVDSTFGVSESHGVMEGVRCGPCRECGQTAFVPDGYYSVTEDVIQFGPLGEVSRWQAIAIAALLREAAQKNLPVEQIAAQVDERVGKKGAFATLMGYAARSKPHEYMLGIAAMLTALAAYNVKIPGAADVTQPIEPPAIHARKELGGPARTEPPDPASARDRALHREPEGQAPSPAGEGASEAASSSPPTVENETFSNQEVVLDGNFFSRCSFENVTLVYRGDELFGIEHCEFVGEMQFKFDGPAGNTLRWMQVITEGMGALGKAHVLGAFPAAKAYIDWELLTHDVEAELGGAMQFHNAPEKGE